MKVKLYIEGGGDGQLLDAPFRQGWSAFFKSAGLATRMPRVVRGGGRSQTFDKFVTAVRTAREDELPLLLVDSEDTPSEAHTPWQHLKARDSFDRPPGARDDQAFLMVCVMETWLLADRELLRRFFPSLREQHFPGDTDPEGVSKARVLKGLAMATAGCAKPYAKGRVSFELLAELSAPRVRAACPAAQALLKRLGSA